MVSARPIMNSNRSLDTSGFLSWSKAGFSVIIRLRQLRKHCKTWLDVGPANQMWGLLIVLTWWGGPWVPLGVWLDKHDIIFPNMELHQKYPNIISIYGILHNDYVSISQQFIPYMEIMLGYFWSSSILGNIMSCLCHHTPRGTQGPPHQISTISRSCIWLCHAMLPQLP